MNGHYYSVYSIKLEEQHTNFYSKNDTLNAIDYNAAIKKEYIYKSLLI